MQTQQITDWSDGLNVLVDPRRLKPNSSKDATAGSPDMVNTEITKQAALITSKGYEVVSEIASTGGIKSLLDYNKDDDSRFLIITHGTNHYSISPSDTTWSTTNLGAYGLEADYAGGVVFKGNANYGTGTFTISNYANLINGGSKDQIKILNYILTATDDADVATPGAAYFLASGSNEATAKNLATQINSHYQISIFVNASVSGAVVTLTATNPGERAYAIEYINNTGSVGAAASAATLTGGGDGRIAVLGTGESTNTNRIKEATITGAMSDILDSSVSGSYIMDTFMERLFVAKGRTVYYSKVNDETALEGAIGFNDIVKGFRVDGPRLTVFTRSYNQGVKLTYDNDNLLTLPQKEPYEREYGCLAHKTVHSVYSDTIYWSPFGIMKLGAEVNYDDFTPRSQSMSKVIDPLLENANFNNDAAAKACAIFNPFDQQSYISIPYDTASYNNYTFVYNWNWGAWTVRTGLAPDDWAFFRESDKDQDQMYFTDNFNSRLLKMNNSYSYDGGGYVRKWTSKTFTHGADFLTKKWHYLKIAGSMYATTEYTVKIEVDGVVEEFKVNSDSLVKDKFGEYIGDALLGDNNLGGDPATSKFKRYKTKLMFPATIREGFEMKITVTNDAAEQPWKIDFMEIGYDYISPRQVPAKAINNNRQ